MSERITTAEALARMRQQLEAERGRAERAIAEERARWVADRDASASGSAAADVALEALDRLGARLAAGRGTGAGT